MSINVEFTVGEVRIHACTFLRAKADSLSDVHWITIFNQRDEEVTFFTTSAEVAETYAASINACNDREVIEMQELARPDQPTGE